VSTKKLKPPVIVGAGDKSPIPTSDVVTEVKDLEPTHSKSPNSDTKE